MLKYKMFFLLYSICILIRRAGIGTIDISIKLLT